MLARLSAKPLANLPLKAASVATEIEPPSRFSTFAKERGLPEVQLYNLSADFGEQHNVYQQHPDRVADMIKTLETLVANGRSTPGPPLSNDAQIVIWKSR